MYALMRPYARKWAYSYTQEADVDRITAANVTITGNLNVQGSMGVGDEFLDTYIEQLIFPESGTNVAIWNVLDTLDCSAANVVALPSSTTVGGSSLQTYLADKAPTESPTFTGTVAMPETVTFGGSSLSAMLESTMINLYNTSSVGLTLATPFFTSANTVSNALELGWSTAAGWNCTASAAHELYPGWQLLKGGAGDEWRTPAASFPDRSGNESIMVEYPVPVRIVSFSYTVAEAGYGPKRRYVEGSSDGATWVELYTIVADDFVGDFGASVGASVAYRYLRFRVTSLGNTTGNNQLRMQTLMFMVVPTLVV